MTSIGFHGNVVAVWEKVAAEYERSGQLLVDLGSDQTSCHNPYSGGYYPVELSYAEAQQVCFFILLASLRITAVSVSLLVACKTPPLYKTPVTSNVELSFRRANPVW